MEKKEEGGGKGRYKSAEILFSRPYDLPSGISFLTHGSLLFHHSPALSSTFNDFLRSLTIILSPSLKIHAFPLPREYPFLLKYLSNWTIKHNVNYVLLRMGAYTGTLKDPQDHQGSAYKEPKSSSPGRLHSKVKSLEVKGSLLESEEQNDSEFRPASALGIHAWALGCGASCKRSQNDGDDNDHETQLR